MEQTDSDIKKGDIRQHLLFLLLLLAGLYVTSLHNFLLFHSLVELFGILVACSIFMLVWNTRNLLRDNLLKFIGIAWFFVAGLDLFYTLSYGGMGVFDNEGANLSAQLWIAARYLQGIALLAAPLFAGREMKETLVFVCFGLVFALVLAFVFLWDLFPVFFDPETGATGYKTGSEYLTCCILAGAAGLLAWKRSGIDAAVFRLILTAIAVTMAAELTLALSAAPYGPTVVLGHYLKFLSFYLVYMAVIETGLMHPYKFLFRDLKNSAEAFEKTVAERTRELSEANLHLKREIENRRNIEEKLKAAELRYRAVADFTYNWEYWELPDGSLGYMSPSCMRFTGYDAESFIEIPGLLRDIIHPEDVDNWQAHKDLLVKGVSVGSIQFRIRRKDGGLRWIDQASKIVESNQKEYLGIRVSNRDITKKRQAITSSVQHREELAHVLRIATMGELAFALAHELNQPLTSILSNAQAAMRYLNSSTPDLDEVREIVSDIAADDKRAGEVIRRLKNLLQRGDMEFKPLDVNRMIQEVLPLLYSDAVIRDITITIELAAGLPRVQGDFIQLQQVIMNLIRNASDAVQNLDKERRRVVISSKKKDTENILVEVKDFGKGLYAADVDKLFHPFYTTKPDGLGMGLSISRSICEAHGGRLWALPNGSRGATFVFSLPIKHETLSSVPVNPEST